MIELSCPAELVLAFLAYVLIPSRLDFEINSGWQKGNTLIINKELEQVKNELQKILTEVLPDNALKTFVLLGSKYVRSVLAILYLKSQNIEINNEIYKILVAGELIHNSSLLHDDVIDNAEKRRGNATIARRFSSKVSILAGDFLLSLAIENLLYISDIDILNSFKDCVKNMTEAEIRQFFLRGKLPTEKEYLDICKGKTAGLFSVVLESCAKFSKIKIQNAKTFGEMFGIYFQIKNDLQEESARVDKLNGICTAKDILGIEKTTNLLDNYKEEMSKLIKDFPENIYKEGLEELIKSL